MSFPSFSLSVSSWGLSTTSTSCSLLLQAEADHEGDRAGDEQRPRKVMIRKLGFRTRVMYSRQMMSPILPMGLNVGSCGL